jgi:hypothetical protein
MSRSTEAKNPSPIPWQTKPAPQPRPLPPDDIAPVIDFFPPAGAILADAMSDVIFAWCEREWASVDPALQDLEREAINRRQREELGRRTRQLSDRRDDNG